MGNCPSFCTNNNNSNDDDEHDHQEQEEDAPLPQPQIVVLTPGGQKVRSILEMKPEEFPLYFINNINELMNDIAETGEFLSVVRSMSADDLFVRDAQHRQEDEQRAHQEQDEDEEEEELLQPRIVLLTPEGQNVRSVLSKKPEDLRPCVMNEINALMNDIATGDFLSTARTSIAVDFGLTTEEQHRREQQQQQRGLTITIVHKDWHKIEKKYETAVRLFPDILQETRGGIYLIQWMSMHWTKVIDYNLRLVSLIPLIVRLGIQLQQFTALERGGLLSLYPSGRTPLQFIIGYKRNEHTTNATDECYSAVVERLRKENLFMKEDVQQYNVGRQLYTRQETNGNFLESRVQCLIDMDPMTLSLPCYPEKGNCLPLHWSTNNKDSREFNFVFKAGMKNFPKKFGFLFCVGTHRNSDDGKVIKSTPFQRACRKYGQETVTKLVMDCITEYCSFSTSSSAANDKLETSLLVSAIIDEAIDIDCLSFLLRKDPIDAFLRLQQHFHRQQQLEEGDGQTVALSNIQQQVLRVVEGEGQTGGTDTNTNTHSHDNNSKGATDTNATTAVSASMTTTTVSATTTTTVSSPPTATAAPRDSLAIIPFQASMDPTVSTSGTGTGTGTTNNNNSHNISEKEAEEELKIVGQEEVAAATSAIAATEAVTSRGVVQEEEEPQERMDDAAAVVIPEGVFGSDDAAYALLTTAVVESNSYDDSTTRTTVDVDEDQDEDELKAVRTEVVAAIAAATDVVEAVTSREVVVVAKEEIIPMIADDEDEAPGGGVEESKEEAPEVEDEGAAEAPPTPTTTASQIWEEDPTDRSVRAVTAEAEDDDDDDNVVAADNDSVVADCRRS